MEYVWTPWRMEYILGDKNKGCVFCEGINQADGINNLIIFRSTTTFVILNRYPYTSGHLMIVPFEHKSSIEDLNPEIRAEMMELSARAMRVLRKEYQPQGFNLGLNIGHAAGAGIADHVHMHVVPRWGGDTNFMSSLANARVLPELLEDTYQRVFHAWYQSE